jgi:hypothetical protein
VRSTEMNRSRLGVPQGYVAIPVAEDQKQSTLRICVLVKAPPGAAERTLVSLRSTLDARVLLGCITDAGGQVQGWLEVSIQNTDLLRSTSLGKRLFLSNALLDDRWQKRTAVFEQGEAADVIRCGWEHSDPLPTFLDAASLSPVHPKDEMTGACWRLCRDEGILQSHDLPSYAGSLHRYLYLPEHKSKTLLVPVTEGAPTNGHTKPLGEICPNCDTLIPFNPAAGRILVTRHYPMDLENFLDVLAGVPAHRRISRSVVALDQDEASPGGGWASDYVGRLFLESRGKHSRLLEVLHLKLALLFDAVHAVYSVIRDRQQPFLNLGPESFRVELDRHAGPLPFLWTARARLVEPGHALAVQAGATDVTYYVSPLTGETSVYRPAAASLPALGRAVLRLREVLVNSENTVTAEGTLATDERLGLNASDLIVLQLRLPSGALFLHAHLETDTALAGGEYRFRTLPRPLRTDEIREMQSAKGVPMPDIPFEIIPLLSSPCDLYSLAILAVRILLVGPERSLPIAVDEILSLARRVQAECDPAQPLPSCVARVFQSDPRWLPSLGPHHLTEEQITPEEAWTVVPPELWWSTLALIVRMMPGLGPLSLCRDYGDARPGGLHLAFERILAELGDLIVRTRYLVAPDLRSDRLIAAVIHRCLDGYPDQDEDVSADHKHHK